MMTDRRGPELPPPVDDGGEPEHSTVPHIDIMLDFRPNEPRVRITGARLQHNPTAVRLALRLPSEQNPVMVDLDEVTRTKIAEIGGRYDEVELTIDAYRARTARSSTSPLAKVQDLMELQQTIETANVLRQDAFARTWWKQVRPHLVRTNQEYEGIFGRLRDQLRNERNDGVRVLRTLLESPATVLVNLGLRLTELEPGLGAIVQRDLARLYTDETLDENLRYRAYHGLQGRPRIRAVHSGLEFDHG